MFYDILWFIEVILEVTVRGLISLSCLSTIHMDNQLHYISLSELLAAYDPLFTLLSTILITKQLSGSSLHTVYIHVFGKWIAEQIMDIEIHLTIL